MDILPSKKIISRLLFDYDARYNFNKYIPVIESIYDLTPGKAPSIPEKFKGNDLLIFQRVLSQIRKQTHTINPLLLQLENDLIEYAAERGSRDALCTLSFMALDDSGEGWTEDDKNTAKSYIKELMELEHPLAFKLAADRELKRFTNSLEEGKGNEKQEEKVDTTLSPTEEVSFSDITTSSQQLSRAISLYEHFLKLDPSSTVAAAAHRSLGMINFRLQDLVKAEEHFSNAVQLAPVSDNSQAHFFLGLLHEKDPQRARYHFQMAATEGFRESFANLGYIELNVFNDPDIAKEWFALGAELGVPECVVGLFDVAHRKKDWVAAQSVIEKADNLGVSKLLNEVRADSIASVKEKYKSIEKPAVVIPEKSETPQSAKSRWDI
ncbi:hypothetical protein CANINC_000368 [Pichia inconspicua]|uniref:Uncharacterized protein n=1 Tax=Pichia inconspicua TaxID=52247 RepID=A0A4T0X7D9_9ASCO|nr:hypothetical protein CANINC_000368 [[Candida] inconspicua]